MRERVTLEAILLPDRRIATAEGAPIPGARWRVMECTGSSSSDICFVAARIGGERWYARSSPNQLRERETGLAVNLERFREHASVRLSSVDHQRQTTGNLPYN